MQLFFFPEESSTGMLYPSFARYRWPLKTTKGQAPFPWCLCVFERVSLSSIRPGYY